MVSFTRGRPDSRAPILKAVGVPNQFVDTAPGSLTTLGVSGRQAWAYELISGVADLQSIGNTLAPNNGGSEIPPARYLLQTCQHNMKFSNVGQGTVKLTILHLRQKRDLYTTMTYTAPTGAVYPFNGNPTDCVRQGIQAAIAGATTGGVAYLIPGVDESESPIFNAYFGVVKKTEVLLAVGGTHKLTTNVKYDRVLDASVYGNDFLVGMLGVSDWILMKAEGQSGVTGSTLDPPSQDITIAPCQIVYTQNWDYKFTQVANSKRFLRIDDPIGAASVPVNIVSGATGSGVTATGLIV